MGRRYAVPLDNVTITNANGDWDAFEITPADDKPVRFLGLLLSQSTEVGDTQEEFVRVKVVRGHTTSGSGGSAATPAPLNPSDAAAGFTAEVGNTTIASAGTAVDLFCHAFNVRAGLEFYWTPETATEANQANTTMVVRVTSTVADDINFSGTLYVEEV